MTKKTSKLENVNTWAVLIGTLLGAAVSAIVFYQFLYPDSPAFAVQVEAETVAIPSDLFRTVERYESEVDKLRYEDMPKELRQKIDGIPRLELLPFKEITRHVKMSITNTGNRAAENLALQIGHDGFVIVTKNQQASTKPFTDRLALDKLGIRETVKLEWWDNGLFPRRDDAVEICHDNGVQTVEMPRFYTGIADAYISQTGFLGFISLMLVGVAAWIILGNWTLVRVQSKGAPVAGEAEREGGA